jgi:two-component system NtrC family sensor kinase
LVTGGPFELERFGLDEMAACSEVLRGFGSESSSSEEASQKTADYLYRNLVGRDGEPACALVRVYKTHPYLQLEPELQAFATKVLGAEPAPDTRCLTLLGTAGDLAEWYSRQSSEGHRAIPLESEEMVHRLPMVLHLITQLGLDVSTVVAPPRDRLVELSQRTYDVFHVEEAAGSPYIPAQGFVREHAIRSAVGYGGILLGGDFYATMLFAKVPVSREVAATLKILSLATRVSLFPFGSRQAFARPV